MNIQVRQASAGFAQNRALEVAVAGKKPTRRKTRRGECVVAGSNLAVMTWPGSEPWNPSRNTSAKGFVFGSKSRP